MLARTRVDLFLSFFLSSLLGLALCSSVPLDLFASCPVYTFPCLRLVCEPHHQQTSDVILRCYYSTCLAVAAKVKRPVRPFDIYSYYRAFLNTLDPRLSSTFLLLRYTNIHGCSSKNGSNQYFPAKPLEASVCGQATPGKTTAYPAIHTIKIVA